MTEFTQQLAKVKREILSKRDIWLFYHLPNFYNNMYMYTIPPYRYTSKQS